MLADTAAGLHVVVADLGCAPVGRRDAFEVRQVLHAEPHLLQRPAQVDGGGALLGQIRRRAVYSLVGRILPYRHGEAVGGRGADQRRAAHLHRQDRARGLLHRFERDDGERVRQQRLVDDFHRPAVGREPDGAVGLAVDFHASLPGTGGPKGTLIVALRPQAAQLKAYHSA